MPKPTGSLFEQPRPSSEPDITAETEHDTSRSAAKESPISLSDPTPTTETEPDTSEQQSDGAQEANATAISSPQSHPSSLATEADVKEPAPEPEAGALGDEPGPILSSNGLQRPSGTVSAVAHLQPWMVQTVSMRALSGTPTIKQKIIKRRLLQRARARYQRMSSGFRVLLCALVVGLLLPALLVITEGINTFMLYQQAQSGMQHLTNVQRIFSSKDINGNTLIFDVDKLERAQYEVDAAHDDFVQVRDKLHSEALVRLLGGVLPAQIGTVRSLSEIGVEATEIAQQGIKAALVIAPTLPDPTLKDQSKPLANAVMMDQARSLLDVVIPKVKKIITYSHGVVPGSLPLSTSQQKTLNNLITLLPTMVDELEMAQDFLKTGALDWIIGVDQPRHFLVQPLDRAELRAAGGFTGQFGILDLNGGRMGTLKLKNVGIYEEHLEGLPNDDIYTYISNNSQLPERYSWWPIVNFGIRDSNVSADFPSSAETTITLFNKLYPKMHPKQFPHQVDGLISFSPFLMARMLRITGPITIEQYDETITADNLEEKLHYYQLDNAGIAKEKAIEGPDLDDASARKLFTGHVAEEMMSRVKNLSPKEVVNLLPMVLEAMKTRDLQVYFDNPEAEAMIAKYGSAATIDTSDEHDGLFIVQSNVSVSKASQYVRTYVQDTVTLDASGGATHELTMRLAYTQIGPVYGFETYFDYVRIYVPENSQFLWGTGFSQLGTTQCSLNHGGGVPCQADVFGNGSLVCPPNSDFDALYPGLDNAGYPYNTGLAKIGAPTNMESDQPGRKMFGGWLQLFKNCNLTVKLSWYVPDVAKGKPYSLLFQRQSGTLPIVNLTILPASGACEQLKTEGLYFNGVLAGEDKMFTVPTSQKVVCDQQMKI